MDADERRLWSASISVHLRLKSFPSRPGFGRLVQVSDSSWSKISNPHEFPKILRRPSICSQLFHLYVSKSREVSGRRLNSDLRDARIQLTTSKQNPLVR